MSPQSRRIPLPMGLMRLKSPLEKLYRTYHAGYLKTDPLELVHGFAAPEDREVAGLIAAVFAYGRVEQIRKTLEQIFEPMGGAPRAYILDFDPDRDGGQFGGIVHRFNKSTDVLALLCGIREALLRHGSLQTLFLAEYSSEQADVAPALSAFVDGLLDFDATPLFGRPSVPSDSTFRFLLPSPRRGSACKRLNMYLRWMVRCDDGLDLGLWDAVSPSQLIIPLDTHVWRLSRRLGLTERRSADWKTAVDITAKLRCLDPEDPVKYDFALARLGILGRCLKEMDRK
ncbi:MAG: TIGR02757 family protein, partial [bacterium]|nr:TIGR02757 family protein [bacterium]